MSDEDVKAELERLRAENERLKSEKKSGRAMSPKVSEKGGVSVYGLGHFPVTLYKEQWTKLLDMADEMRGDASMVEQRLHRHGRRAYLYLLADERVRHAVEAADWKRTVAATPSSRGGRSSRRASDGKALRS